MTKPLSTTIEEIADIVASATVRATKALREASEAVAEMREAEMTLKGFIATNTLVDRRPIAIENQIAPKDENPRLAYRPEEVASILGVSRATIWRRIKTGELASVKRFGARLVTSASVEALFEIRE